MSEVIAEAITYSGVDGLIEIEPGNSL